MTLTYLYLELSTSRTGGVAASVLRFLATANVSIGAKWILSQAPCCAVFFPELVRNAAVFIFSVAYLVAHERASLTPLFVAGCAACSAATSVCVPQLVVLCADRGFALFHVSQRLHDFTCPSTRLRGWRDALTARVASFAGATLKGDPMLDHTTVHGVFAGVTMLLLVEQAQRGGGDAPAELVPSDVARSINAVLATAASMSIAYKLAAGSAASLRSLEARLGARAAVAPLLSPSDAAALGAALAASATEKKLLRSASNALRARFPAAVLLCLATLPDGGSGGGAPPPLRRAPSGSLLHAAFGIPCNGFARTASGGRLGDLAALSQCRGRSSDAPSQSSRFSSPTSRSPEPHFSDGGLGGGGVRSAPRPGLRLPGSIARGGGAEPQALPCPDDGDAFARSSCDAEREDARECLRLSCPDVCSATECDRAAMVAALACLRPRDGSSVAFVLGGGALAHSHDWAPQRRSGRWQAKARENSAFDAPGGGAAGGGSASAASSTSSGGGGGAAGAGAEDASPFSDWRRARCAGLKAATLATAALRTTSGDALGFVTLGFDSAGGFAPADAAAVDSLASLCRCIADAVRCWRDAAAAAAEETVADDEEEGAEAAEGAKGTEGAVHECVADGGVPDGAEPLASTATVAEEAAEGRRLASVDVAPTLPQPVDEEHISAGSGQRRQ